MQNRATDLLKANNRRNLINGRMDIAWRQAAAHGFSEVVS
jgi:hypothetical protein